MASRDNMLETVRDFNGKVTSLSSICLETTRKVYTLLQDAEQNWWGESGSAMAYALYDAYDKLKKARAMLDDAAGRIENEMWYRYNNWPSEEEKK